MEIINNECYVSLEVAKLLKKVGFDWNCRKIYYCYHEDNDTWELEDNYKNHQYILELDYCLLAPTLEVAQRWLREVKGLSIESNVMKWVNRYQTNECTIFWKYIIQTIDTSSLEAFFKIVNINNALEFNTFEDALEAGIKKALETILEKGE